jgi:hypothetical protein
MKAGIFLIIALVCMGFGADPSWYPAWQAPGIIKAIPNSTLKAAIAANGWTAPDPVAGGTGWPKGLWAYSGACVGYIQDQPYVMVSGGGHATHGDNSIYAFGPLYGQGSDTPHWSRISTQSAASAIQGSRQGGSGLGVCPQLYSDNRPSSRHTVGDFNYHPAGYIVMMWVNSSYCSNAAGGPACPIDVFDIKAGEWETAKTPRVNRDCNTLNQMNHSPSCYHIHDGYLYAIGKGTSNNFGRYDLVNDVFKALPFSGPGCKYAGRIISMGPRDYLYCHKNSGDNAIRVNTQTGVSGLWAYPTPNGSGSASDYDALQDRVYMCLPGITTDGADNMPDGTKQVAWIDAGATSSPSWTIETLNGDTPHQTGQWSGWGHFSYVKELRGFAYSPAYDSPVFIYCTAQGTNSISNQHPKASRIPTKIYPNPFKPATSIEYSVQQKGRIHIAIYDLKGRMIKQLRNDELSPGTYKVLWDGTTRGNKRAFSGLYICQIISKNTIEQKRLFLIK